MSQIMCSEGVYNPVTARFLSLSLLFSGLLSSLLSLRIQHAPSHPSQMMEWLPRSAPRLLSPVTLHRSPNILRVCQTGCFPEVSRCPCQLKTHACAHTHTHTHACTHNNVRHPTVIVRQCWPLGSISVKAHTHTSASTHRLFVHVFVWIMCT